MEVDKSVVLDCTMEFNSAYHHECTRLSLVILLVAKLLSLFQLPTTHTLHTHTHTHTHNFASCYYLCSNSPLHTHTHRTGPAPFAAILPVSPDPSPAAWTPSVPILCCSGCCEHSRAPRTNSLSPAEPALLASAPPWAARAFPSSFCTLTPCPSSLCAPASGRELFLQVLALWDLSSCGCSTLTPAYVSPCIIFSLLIYLKWLLTDKMTVCQEL